MRLTKEELLSKHSWNINNPYNGDIVAVLYGDIPHMRYNYDTVRMQNSNRMGYFDNDLDDTIAAIQGVDHYIYSQEGDFAKYYTLIGGVRVFKNWFIGTADLNIKYNGHIYNLTLCDLYGRTELHLSLNTSSIFRTYDIGSSSKWISTKWTPMSKEEALKVVDVKRVADYGDVIKMAVEKCRKIIEEN